MFTADDLLARTRRPPFLPFRIVTTTGKAYEIYHPDQAMAARRFVSVPTTPAMEGVPENFSDIAILHIVEIQDGIPTPSAPGGTIENGPE